MWQLKQLSRSVEGGRRVDVHGLVHPSIELVAVPLQDGTFYSARKGAELRFRVRVFFVVFSLSKHLLCDITCVLEFVGDDISAADVKHMIWKFQNAGVTIIFSYV